MILRPSMRLKCFKLFVTRVKLCASAQDAMVKSKSSRRLPDFSNDALSIPKFSADSLPFGIISNVLSIVLTFARLLDNLSDL